MTRRFAVLGAKKSLQCRPNSQKLNVGFFQHSQYEGYARHYAQRFQQGQVAPKRSKSRSAVNDGLTFLPGMEASEKLPWVKGAIRGRINIDELNALEPIQSFHEGNFFRAQRALAVEPNLHLGFFAFHLGPPPGDNRKESVSGKP
jgi:hypothetical protein